MSSRSDHYDQFDPNREFYDAAGELSFDGYSPASYEDTSHGESNDAESAQNYQRDDSYDRHPRDDTTNYFVQPRVSFACEICRSSFSSRNKLFKHIKLLKHQKKPTMTHGEVVTNMFADMGSTPEVICSDAPPVKGDGLAFRDYNYLELAMRTSPESSDKSVCGDSGCGMSCIDKKFFMQEYPNIQPSVVDSPIEIRGLGGKMTMSTEFAVLPVYFPGHKPGSKTKALARVEKEFHIVENLSCNALIGNDILKPEKMSIDLEHQQIKIGSCGGLVCPVRIVPRDKPINNRMVRTTTTSRLRSHAKTLVPVRIKGLPQDRDFRFIAQYNASNSYLAVCGHFPEAIIDANSQFVAYYNNSESDIMLPANSSIGHVREWDLTETATKENPDVINCHFAVPGILPSIKFAAKIGLTALQCAQALGSGQVFYPKPDVMLGKELQADSYALLPRHVQAPINPNSLLPDIASLYNKSTSESNAANTPTQADIFSLLPRLEPTHEKPSKFGAGAVNVNDTDDITPEQVTTLKNVLSEFPTLWEDRIGRVIEPEEDWMEIPLKEGAVIESRGRYKVSKRDEAAIDEVFDRALQDGRMSLVHGVIPAGWPVFVVWNKGKARPVVDLRGLNKLVVRDSYPLPYQDAILEPISGKCFISIVDLQKAYYQRYIRKHERWKTTVLTHRGQEQFNVVPMGYAVSPSHMQKFMDKVLRKHWKYARCYIDDIVIFSDTFEEHVEHLRAVLLTLSELGMTLSPDKCYIAYHSVQLLGHVVDRYGLSTLPEKVSAIASMEFPKHLKDLELFIGLSGYYRHFIARYAALIEPLQKRKTVMLRGVARRGKDRTSQTKLIQNPSELELASFQIIKDALCSPKLLVHHDHKLPLLVYVDSSVEGGFAAAVHQVPKDTMQDKKLTVEDILNGRHDKKLERPVNYLSRMLNKHEVNYWPTELEIAGIIWTMQKIRHLIEGSNPTKIFTDHKGAEDIMDMTTLKTKSTVRQNLRLTRASQFVSQYPNVKIVYRKGRDNVNADALSRLIHLRTQHHPDNDTEGVYGFIVTVVGLSMATLSQLEEGYRKDRHLSFIYDEVKSRLDKKDLVLRREIPSDEVLPYNVFEEIDKFAPETVQYQGFQGRLCYNYLLLYIVDPLDGHPRLCIPANCHKIFFEAAHDNSTHAGFEKAYKKLRPNYYIKNLAASLRAYIRSCPSCQVNNTLRHKPYGLLQLISTPASPFEMVTLDLVVKLPPSEYEGQEYDSIMTVTDKLTKMSTLILGRENWTAEQWANAFFRSYYRRWGVPSRIITDRGKVFLSDFWTALFRILRTTLLVTTAYHPQSDGQSERTNQTVEIALRHLVNVRKNNWASCLAEVEFTMNNTVNASTGKSPMQFLAGMNAPSALDAARHPVPLNTATDWFTVREELRDDARHALTFAQAKMSVYYDRKHTPISFKKGDLAYIRLAGSMEPGYHLPDTSHKLSQQRVGPFKVVDTVGKLAYKLDVPASWKIHPVISVAHLERHTPDTFDRTSLVLPDVVVGHDGQEEEEWEVEDIVRERYNKRRKRQEYYVKWKGFGPENNTWEPVENLVNSQEAMDRFKDNLTTVASTYFLPAPSVTPRYEGSLSIRFVDSRAAMG